MSSGIRSPSSLSPIRGGLSQRRSHERLRAKLPALASPRDRRDLRTNVPDRASGTGPGRVSGRSGRGGPQGLPQRRAWRAARPVWPAFSGFTRGSTLVRVVAFESALAVWEAITVRDKSGWLVVLTDREDDDLGAGIRAHLVGNRLRTPDPSEAVRQRFAAGLDPALTSSPCAPGVRDRPARRGPGRWPAAGSGRGADPRSRVRHRGPRAPVLHRPGRRPDQRFCAGRPIPA